MTSDSPTSQTPAADGGGVRATPQRTAGMLAQFSSAAALVAAARAVREEGYQRTDAHSPFPIHGIDGALGVRRTRLPYLVFFAGIAGAVGAMGLQWWTNAVEIPLGPIVGYQINVSGKPFFSVPANIPVAFEAVVLLAAFAAFFGVLALNRLPRFSHPWMRSPRFAAATDDAFFLSIEAADPRFDAAGTRALLESLGAVAVELVEEPVAPPKVPASLTWIGLILVTAALIPPLLIAKARYTKSEQPRIHLVPDMDFQPKYKAQSASLFFADRRSARPPVPGTIAEGQLWDDDHFYRGRVPAAPDAAENPGEAGAALAEIFAESFPLPVTPERMARGRQRYDIFCAACHGYDGEGDGMTIQRALRRGQWIRPVSLHAEDVRRQPPGQLFHSISYGVRTMPGYAEQISPEDRWAIVLYLYALQRSRGATLEDVPPELRDRLLPSP